MKIAVVQMDIKIAEVDRNLAAIADRFREAVSNGANLAIFPECAVTGYCFEDLAEARPFAQSIPGPATEFMVERCKELNAFAVFGMIEIDGDHTYNAAVLVGAEGLIGSYRKVHLPFLGVDQHVDYGNREFEVHQAADVNIGMNICYDSAFPESSRALAIAGADLIALPTNWPSGAECVAENVIATRALENAIYFAAANRVGEERGFRFIGMSRICAPSGATLAVADGESEVILYADIDVQQARMKQVVREPGRHAIDRMADRRPEMYGALLEPHSLPRPGRAD
jgi:predicted amidohydrolase